VASDPGGQLQLRGARGGGQDPAGLSRRLAAAAGGCRLDRAGQPGHRPGRAVGGAGHDSGETGTGGAGAPPASGRIEGRRHCPRRSPPGRTLSGRVPRPTPGPPPAAPGDAPPGGLLQALRSGRVALRVHRGAVRRPERAPLHAGVCPVFAGAEGRRGATAHAAGRSGGRRPRPGRVVRRQANPLQLEEIARRRRLPPVRDDGPRRQGAADHLGSRVRRLRGGLPARRRHPLQFHALRTDGRLLVDRGEQPLHVRPGGPVPAAAHLRSGAHQLPDCDSRRPRPLYPLGLQRPGADLSPGAVPDESRRQRPDGGLRQQLVVSHGDSPRAGDSGDGQDRVHFQRASHAPAGLAGDSRPAPRAPGEPGGATDRPGACDAGGSRGRVRAVRRPVPVSLCAERDGVPGGVPARWGGAVRDLLDVDRWAAGASGVGRGHFLQSAGAAGPTARAAGPSQPRRLPHAVGHRLSARRVSRPGTGGRGSPGDPGPARDCPRVSRGRDRQQREPRACGRGAGQHADLDRGGVGREASPGHGQDPRGRLGLLHGPGANAALLPGARRQGAYGPVDAELGLAPAGRDRLVRRLPRAQELGPAGHSPQPGDGRRAEGARAVLRPAAGVQLPPRDPADPRSALRALPPPRRAAALRGG